MCPDSVTRFTWICCRSKGRPVCDSIVHSKPAASVSERTQYKATIQAIDKEHGTAKLKGYDGEEFVITPLHPENLDKVAIGELVVFTYTEVMAVSVEKVAPAKKK